MLEPWGWYPTAGMVHLSNVGSWDSRGALNSGKGGVWVGLGGVLVTVWAGPAWPTLACAEFLFFWGGGDQKLCVIEDTKTVAGS